MGPCYPEGEQRKELMGSLSVKRLGGLRHRAMGSEYTQLNSHVGGKDGRVILQGVVTALDFEQ